MTLCVYEEAKMKRTLVFATILWGSLALLACDAAEQILDGEESALREPDLPNCSKILTCCAALKARDISSDIDMECDDTFIPSVNSVIDAYQDTKSQLDPSTEAYENLYDETRSTVEPGCRCFLEQTVGQVSDVLLPVDCEVDTSVGQTGADQCDGAINDLTNGDDQ